jgi:apolipoprotein N-acyltransferase
MDISSMNTERSRALVLLMGSALDGVIAWSGWMPAIALAIFMPIAVTLQKDRRHAFLTALAYYTGASWPLIPGAKAFFGPNVTWFESVLLWLSSSFLLALPFGVCWTKNPHKRPIGILFALIVITVPPIGLIGWAAPLTAAGILFPGLAWFGLVSISLVCSLFVIYRRLVSTFAVLLALTAHATYQQPVPPPSWRAIDTKFGSGFSAYDPLREFAIAEAIQRTIRTSNDKVLIFPEMVINRWNDAVEAFWEPTLAYLRQTNKTVLIGAGLPIQGQNSLYLNSAVILGDHPSSPFIQRISVPIAMWKPFSPSKGVPLHLAGAGTMTVAGKRAAILICYEQFLPWPYIHSALERPNVVIGLANDYWASGTPIPAVQNASLHAWARLFNFPCISATNN